MDLWISPLLIETISENLCFSLKHYIAYIEKLIFRWLLLRNSSFEKFVFPSVGVKHTLDLSLHTHAHTHYTHTHTHTHITHTHIHMNVHTYTFDCVKNVCACFLCLTSNDKIKIHFANTFSAQCLIRHLIFKHLEKNRFQK